MSTTFHVLVVCTGNICRSPLAERLLRRRLDDLLGEHAEQFSLSSAGMHPLVDEVMDAAALTELTRLGGNADGHLSRAIAVEHVRGADLVLTATREHRSELLALWPEALRRTFTLLEFAHLVHGQPPMPLDDLVQHAARMRGGARIDDYDVPDPFRGDELAHRQAADMIAVAVDEIANALARSVSVAR